MFPRPGRGRSWPSLRPSTLTHLGGEPNGWRTGDEELEQRLVPYSNRVYISIWGGVLKWWVSPNKTHGCFPTKNDQHLGCEMGVPPFKETPIYL